MNPHIMPGDVLLYSSTSLIDDVVRIATESDFDHVAIATDAQHMAEALPGGVRISTIRYPVLWCAGAGWSSAADAVVRSNLGRPYDWLGDAEAALGMPPDDAPHGSMECAQLVNAVLKSLGMKMGSNTPDSVFWHIAAQGRTIQYLLGHDELQIIG